ncbi:CD59 glycoprotein-like [Centroberyx gerrardi]
MKTCLSVFLLAVGVSMFGLGESLSCYSCPDGSTERCEKVQQCSAAENSCLELSSDSTGKTYSKCLQQTDCDFEKLAAMFTISRFKFNCCQSNLCNSAHATAARPLIGLLAGLAALYWVMH